MAWVEHHHGAYVIHRRQNDRGQLVQTDWDYPRAAESLGWSLTRVQRRGHGIVHLKTKPRGEFCMHIGTDGTRKCPDCGIDAANFIGAAGEFLDDKAS